MELPGPLAGRRLLLTGLGALVVAAVGLLVAGGIGRPSGVAAPAAKVAYPIPGGEHGVTVEVLNATQRHGLARTATRELRAAGLDVVYFGNDARQRKASAVVVRRGEAARGDTVAHVLRISHITSEPDTLRRVDVTVYLGADFVPSAPLHP